MPDPIDQMTPESTATTPPLPQDVMASPSVATAAAPQPQSEEVPLAFAAASAPPMAAPPTPPVEPVSSTILPPPAPLPPVMTPPTMPEKKKGLPKMMGVMAGVVLLLMGIVGGYSYYQKNFGSSSLVANIASEYTTPASCNGVCDNGRLLKWRAIEGKCIDSGQPCTGSSGGTTTIVACGTPGSVFCGACGGFCINPVDKACNEMGMIKCGEGPQYGANIVTCGTPAAVKSCDCGGAAPVCFDRQGECQHQTAPGVDDGLCKVSSIAGNTDGVTYKFYCPGMIENTQNGCQKPGVPPNPSCFCGTVQTDGPTGVHSQTMTCGCSGNPSPSSTTANLVCNSLTRTPATESPAIGDKLTFTCAGSITPAGIATLNYKFRYSINSGAMVALANKTPTTAELTIASCGSYKVECQTCATRAGVTKCDPIWTGATQ